MFWRIEKKICLFLLVSLFALSFFAGRNESSRLAENGIDNQQVEYKAGDVISVVVNAIFKKDNSEPSGKTLSEALTDAVLLNLRAKL